ncbi:MAG: GNAT family N-acetyltransferase [Mycobacteriaceae bacterium]|nr:GNAT family N-acetyltransferase [Mycobacteriaceae bacterium]
MSTASVLLASGPGPSGSPDADQSPGAPTYTLLLTTDAELIEQAQRLRYEVFTSEPGFALRAPAGRDADRFDQYCDHLLVREDTSGDLVGCYRMLPPPGAIAAGGLYTATEFDVRALDPLRPSLVEMGRAVVREEHRNGAVVLLMWAGILAYLDRCGYDYVTGCVSVPLAQVRAVREFVLARHRSEYTVRPYRPVPLDDIAPVARVEVPPLMRGYLRLGARVCGEPAHDPDFGVADFLALLDKRAADIRYLKRLRSVAAAAEAVR